jgi:hypothetical protein
MKHSHGQEQQPQLLYPVDLCSNQAKITHLDRLKRPQPHLQQLQHTGLAIGSAALLTLFRQKKLESASRPAQSKFHSPKRGPSYPFVTSDGLVLVLTARSCYREDKPAIQPHLQNRSSSTGQDEKYRGNKYQLIREMPCVLAEKYRKNIKDKIDALADRLPNLGLQSIRRNGDDLSEATQYIQEYIRYLKKWNDRLLHGNHAIQARIGLVSEIIQGNCMTDATHSIQQPVLKKIWSWLKTASS